MTDYEKKIFDQLRNFIGTKEYFQYKNGIVFTNGFNYLVNHLNCYWLAEMFSSHLDIIGVQKTDFVVLNLHKIYDKITAIFTDEDETLLSHESIIDNDFPLTFISLYANWNGKQWVLMLINEY